MRYFTVSLTYPVNALGAQIHQAPGYTRTRGSNMPGLWLCQGSEYSNVLKISGLWTNQGPKYTRALDIPGLHRLLKLAECLWVILEYAWLCLKMPECWPLFCNFKISLNHYSQNSLFQNFPHFFLIFVKGCIADVLQCYEYVYDPQYTMVQDMTLLLNMPGFRI